VLRHCRCDRPILHYFILSPLCITSDGVPRYVSCLETVSRHGFSCLGFGLVSTLVRLVLQWLCLEFPCPVMSHVSWLCLDCISPGMANCLICVQTLAFLAESRPIGLLIRCLLTSCKTVVLVVAELLFYVLINVPWHCFTVSKILTATQSRLSLILDVLARLISCCLCLAMSRVSSIWMMFQSRFVSA